MTEPSPDTEIDMSNEDTSSEQSMRSRHPNDKGVVSQSTHKPEDNGESSAICTETEGNLVPQAITPHDDSVVSIKSPLLPLVINVPQMSPRRRDLTRISNLEESFKNGYDSDGLEGPFFDAVDAEGEQDFDEDSLDGTPNTPVIEEEDAGLSNTPDKTNEVVLTKESVMGMGIKALKEELKKRHLKQYGNKKAIQERLVAAVESGVPIGGPISVPEKSKSNEKGEDKIPTGFHPDSYWKVLSHESVCVDEPSNPTFKAPRAPTHPDCDALNVPVKYNFAETFDRPV